MQIHSVGIDLGKAVFHLVALGAAGTVLVRKKFSQRQLLTYTANMETSLIGLEACSGSHFLGRALRKQGHDVRLIAAQFVKPFVKSNKNDFVDAEAIAEAVERNCGTTLAAQSVCTICATEDGLSFEVNPMGSLEQKREWLRTAGEYVGKQLTVRFMGRTEKGIPKIAVGVVFRLDSDLPTLAL